MEGEPPHIVVLGAASGPRHDSFVAACTARLGRPPATVAWDDFLADPGALAAMLGPGAYLRIDTPDQDVAAIAALYQEGEAAAVSAGIETVPEGRRGNLSEGWIGSPAQLAFGLVAAIGRAADIARARGAIVSTAAEEVACAFDKAATLARLRNAGLPTPRVLPRPNSFDELVSAMATARLPRVFVKLRHGSAAAGMMALARHGNRWSAVTTAVLGAGGRVCATRTVRRITDRLSIAALVDRLAPLGLHVEAWLPKIGIAGQVADLRLVIIDGGPVYPVLRTSRHPMTNLHLGGSRATVDGLVARIGTGAWEALLGSARAAAGCFPRSHALGLDIVVLADGRRHALIEVNPFGDFVKDIEIGGRSIHDAQIARILERVVTPAMAAA